MKQIVRRVDLRSWLISIVCTAIAGCGGGGDGSASASPPSPPIEVIPASSQSAQKCAPDNPYKADAATATTVGTLTTEKQWIRSYVNEAYLWYDGVPTIDLMAATYSGSMSSLDGRNVPSPLSNYFEALKTKALTPSGALVDRFSFTYPTKSWNLFSQSGVTASETNGDYGIEWATLNSSAPNRLWRVALVQPGSPAERAGILRGDTLKSVDGVDFLNGGNVTALNAGLTPALGSSHTLVFSRANSSDLVAVMVSANVAIDPVPLASVVTDPTGRKVGYLHFTDHIASSESKLINAINLFKSANVSDVVLDLRYNGGGYLYLASELAYMIAGPTRVGTKYFEKLEYNAKRTADNAAAATPFYNVSCLLDANYACTLQQPLPTLNLSRVFVIAKNGTCSASESVINGLRGIDVDVLLIGSATCGKPFGFTAKDNCGISYFPIEFKGANYKGFGDYADGFAPTSGVAGNTSLPGCASSDDLDRPLGSVSERMLASALQRAAYGTCPAPIAVSPPSFAVRSGLPNPISGTVASAVDSAMRSPIREGRLLLPSERSR